MLHTGSATPQAALEDLERRYSAEQLIRAKNGLALSSAARRTIQAHEGYQYLQGFQLQIPSAGGSTEFHVNMQILGRFVSSRQYYNLTDGGIWSMSELRGKSQDSLDNPLPVGEASKRRRAVQQLLVHQWHIRQGQ